MTFDWSLIFSRLFSVLVSTLFIVLLGYVGWMIGDRTPPILNLEFVVETPEVKQGDKMKMRVRYVTQKFCHIHYDRFLIAEDDTRVDLPPLDYDAGVGAPGQPEEFVIEVDVPLDFPEGNAIYRVIPTNRCNPVHAFWPIREPVRDTTFVVEKVDRAELEGRVGEALKELLIEELPQQLLPAEP